VRWKVLNPRISSCKKTCEPSIANAAAGDYLDCEPHHRSCEYQRLYTYTWLSTIPTSKKIWAAERPVYIHRASGVGRRREAGTGEVNLIAVCSDEGAHAGEKVAHCGRVSRRSKEERLLIQSGSTNTLHKLGSYRHTFLSWSPRNFPYCETSKT
jgi:hypothetical protein